MGRNGATSHLYWASKQEKTRSLQLYWLLAVSVSLGPRVWVSPLIATSLHCGKPGWQTVLTIFRHQAFTYFDLLYHKIVYSTAFLRLSWCPFRDLSPWTHITIMKSLNMAENLMSPDPPKFPTLQCQVSAAGKWPKHSSSNNCIKGIQERQVWRLWSEYFWNSGLNTLYGSSIDISFCQEVICIKHFLPAKASG